MASQLRNRYRIGVILSFLLTFCIFSSVYYVLVNQSISNEKMRYSYIAKNESNHFITTIDSIMSRTNTLKVLVRDHEGKTDFFDNIAPSIYDAVAMETGVPLKNIAIAPQGVVTDVYPLKGNEALIGFNFLDISHPGNAEAREAYLEGDTVLTNPFQLIQGGIGMAGRSPVLLPVEGESVLWGLVTVTIDFEKLIEMSSLRNFSDMGLEYTLSYITDKGESHVASGVEMIGDDAVKHRFKVRNLTWELAVRPRDGWAAPGQHVIAVCLFLFLSLFAAKFVDMFYELRSIRSMSKNLPERGH